MLSLCDTGAAKLLTRMSRLWHLLPWWCSTLGSVSDLRQILYTWECVWCEKDGLHLGVCLMWERWSTFGCVWCEKDGLHLGVWCEKDGLHLGVSDLKQMLYTWECVWCEKDALHLGVRLMWERCSMLGSVSDVRKMLYAWECVWWGKKHTQHLQVCLMWKKEEEALHLQVCLMWRRKKRLYTCKCVWSEKAAPHLQMCVWCGKLPSAALWAAWPWPASICCVGWTVLHVSVSGSAAGRSCRSVLFADSVVCRLVVALLDDKFLYS